MCSLTYRWHNRSLPVPAYCRRCTKHHCSFMLHRGAKKGFRDYLFKDYCRGRLINNAPIYRFLCSNMTKNIQILCVPPSLAMNKLSCALKSVWFTATAAHAACILLNPHPVSEYVLSNDATKTIKIRSQSFDLYSWNKHDLGVFFQLAKTVLHVQCSYWTSYNINLLRILQSCAIFDKCCWKFGKLLCFCSVYIIK